MCCSISETIGHRKLKLGEGNFNFFLIFLFASQKPNYPTPTKTLVSVNHRVDVETYLLMITTTRVESSRTSLASRTHFEVVGLGLEASSTWPWPRSLKYLALASKPQVFENCPVLGSRTALFFEQLKFRWKTPETERKICEHAFCFPQLEHRRRQGEGGRYPLQIEISPMTKKPIVSSVSVSF